jgi:uncharacterized protein
MLIYLIYPVTATGPPSMPDNKKSPKLQFIDTGLINYFAGLQPDFFKFSDLHSFYRGIIAEHIARQEIIACDMISRTKPAFWVREVRQSSSEVDIVLPYKNYLVPVEIKAGKTGTLKSLHQFINRAPHGFALRLYAGEMEVVDLKTPEGKTFKLLNLPYYLAGKIYEYMDFFINN